MDVLNPVFFPSVDRLKENMFHHDKSKLCEDHNIPLSLCKLHHNMLDFDATIADDEAMQEGPTAPEVGPNKYRNKSLESETSMMLGELTPPTGDTWRDSDLSQTEEQHERITHSSRSLVFSGTVHWFVGRQAFIHYCGLHQV